MPRATRILNIFDLDDTLFKSDAKIKVMYGRRLVKVLSTSDLMTYALRDGERFDFSEFRSGKTFYETARPIKNILNVAKATLNGNAKTIIITAREDLSEKDLFLKKFRDCHFPIDRVYIERAGNLGQGANAAKKVGENKQNIIRGHLNRGIYGYTKMWDDATSNLDAFLALHKEYADINFLSFLVDPNKGTFRRYR